MVRRNVPIYLGSSISHDVGDLHCIYCMQSACSEWKEVHFLHLKDTLEMTSSKCLLSNDLCHKQLFVELGYLLVAFCR